MPEPSLRFVPGYFERLQVGRSLRRQVGHFFVGSASGSAQIFQSTLSQRRIVSKAKRLPHQVIGYLAVPGGCKLLGCLLAGIDSSSLFLYRGETVAGG